MPIRPTVSIVRDIIKDQLSLSDDQIWIYNQRIKIPDTKGLFISIARVGSKVYANNSSYTGSTEELVENQFVSNLETISIDALSQDTSALEYYPDILMSLRSTKAQKMAESYGMRFDSIPFSTADLSSQEGTSMIYRINISFPVYRTYYTSRTIDYYDSFSNNIISD